MGLWALWCSYRHAATGWLTRTPRAGGCSNAQSIGCMDPAATCIALFTSMLLGSLSIVSSGGMLVDGTQPCMQAHTCVST